MKTKKLSARTQQSTFRPPAQKCQFRYPHSNQVNFDPAHKNQDNFKPITEIKSMSMPTLISGRCRCPDTKKRVNFDPTLKTSLFRPPYTNQTNSDLYAEIKVNSDSPHCNQVKFDHPHYRRIDLIPALK